MDLTARRTASVVVIDHNLARYLPDAIESALGQDHPSTEVVVVDDGSTDHSSDVISGYGSRIVPVFQENRGPAAAVNAGFSASRGEAVIFLDGDDVLLPSAISTVMATFDEHDAVKAHWALEIIDSDGRRTGRLKEPRLPDGDFREIACREGPGSESLLPSAPMSGNAWSRRFLSRVLPMPADGFRISADAYLFGLAPLFGPIKRIEEPQSLYRRHPAQHSRAPFERRLERGVAGYDEMVAFAAAHWRSEGTQVDPSSWRQYGWWPRIAESIAEIRSLASRHGADSIIIVDGDSWGADDHLGPVRLRKFLERDGVYWGAPPDDRTAIEELERARSEGCGLIFFAWPAFWWLDHYAGLREHLSGRYTSVLASERLIAFDLAPEASSS